MIRLAVRVNRAQAELVLAELLELAPGGVEESLVGEQTVEYAIYGAPGELPLLSDLRASAGEALVDISTSETADDWQERWKSFHRPVLIEAPAPAGAARRLPALHLRPPWEPAAVVRQTPVEEIVIDPGQAFGTGGHATTRLCLELLLEIAATDPRPELVLDVGTGSGVLAIAAARLGLGTVIGFDHERESVEAARCNAARNGVQIDVRELDLRSAELPWAPGERSSAPVIVLANLLYPLLIALADRIPEPPAHLVAGGLLSAQTDGLVEALAARLGLAERRRREHGEWAAVWLAAP